MDQVFQILHITVPVFALVALGVWLRRRGPLGDEAHAFLSRFVYTICLPVLIFMAVSAKDFGELLNLRVIAATLLATGLVLGGSWLLARRQPPRLRGPVALMAWFANLTFLGLPLAERAYGADGLTYAGIINAFTMPVFVVLAVALLTIGSQRRASWGARVRVAVINPVVLAAAGGVLASLLIHESGLAEWVAGTRVASGLAGISVATLRAVGAMGLPLALIAVGAALRFEHVRGRLGLMFGGAAGKLVLMPALTLLICRGLFPGMEAAAVGTAVLLMGSPLSVGCYVMSKELGADDEFIAGLLVVSTVGACLTVPVWLWVLMA